MASREINYLPGNKSPKMTNRGAVAAAGNFSPYLRAMNAPGRLHCGPSPAHSLRLSARMSAALLDSSTLLAVFQALPGAYLLLSPDFNIEAVSDAYLSETLTERHQLVGRYLFDVFPDNPLAPEAHAVRNLRASLAQVLATGQPHQMALQHYDVPDPERPGQFAARYWLPANTPICDA